MGFKDAGKYCCLNMNSKALSKNPAAVLHTANSSTFCPSGAACRHYPSTKDSTSDICLIIITALIANCSHGETHFLSYDPAF